MTSIWPSATRSRLLVRVATGSAMSYGGRAGANDGNDLAAYLQHVNDTQEFGRQTPLSVLPAVEGDEITAKMGRDPGVLYAALANEFGNPVAERVEAPAGPEQKARLAAMTPQRVTSTELAAEKIESILGQAPGNDVPIGGIKVSAASGWFGSRPSGTEDIYKIYVESFAAPQHPQRVLEDAQAIVDAAMSITPRSGEG